MTGTRTLEDLKQTIRAFQESRVLLTALELDLFQALGEGATAPEAAARAGTDARATGMLLNALVALGALEKAAEVFRCTAESRVFASSRPEFMHTVRRWDTW